MDNCSCDFRPAITIIGQIPICDAPVVGAWFLAVIIGVVGGAKLWSLGPSVVGSFSYSLIFSTYVMMISSGLVVHCLYLVECGLAPPSMGFRDFQLIDFSLTSCVAVMFLYSGLVDLKLIKERGTLSLLSLIAACGSIFYINLNHVLPMISVYKWSILICCGSYLLIQCLLLLHNGVSLRPVSWLTGAAIAGGGSLYTFLFHFCWMCRNLGPWSIEGVWYYGSDVSMFFILLYVLSTRSSSSLSVEKRKSQQLLEV